MDAGSLALSEHLSHTASALIRSVAGVRSVCRRWWRVGLNHRCASACMASDEQPYDSTGPARSIRHCIDLPCHAVKIGLCPGRPLAGSSLAGSARIHSSASQRVQPETAADSTGRSEVHARIDDWAPWQQRQRATWQTRRGRPTPAAAAAARMAAGAAAAGVTAHPWRREQTHGSPQPRRKPPHSARRAPLAAQGGRSPMRHAIRQRCCGQSRLIFKSVST